MPKTVPILEEVHLRDLITRADVLRAAGIYEAAASAAEGSGPNSALNFAVFQILQVQAAAMRAMAGVRPPEPSRIVRPGMN